MGEVDGAEVVTRLIAAGVSPPAAALYGRAVDEYRQAQGNIDEHGTIVANPRTGAPLENPYLKIRDRAEGKIERFTKDHAGSDAVQEILLEQWGVNGR